jgi:hypothetical protein
LAKIVFYGGVFLVQQVKGKTCIMKETTEQFQRKACRQRKVQRSKMGRQADQKVKINMKRRENNRTRNRTRNQKQHEQQQERLSGKSIDQRISRKKNRAKRSK